MLDTLTAYALQAPPLAFSFDRFVLRRRERLLMEDGVPVELGSRAVELLLALVEADGALLSKDAIMDRVWPGVTVEENNIQVQVSALRRVLGPDRAWIATVPGRGYRFTTPVAVLISDKPADVATAVTAPRARRLRPAAPLGARAAVCRPRRSGRGLVCRRRHREPHDRPRPSAAGRHRDRARDRRHLQEQPRGRARDRPRSRRPLRRGRKRARGRGPGADQRTARRR